jgi:predicted transcriptional regulator
MNENNADGMAYQGTSGFVNQPASIARATTEAATGISTERAQKILNTIAESFDGWTWRELAEQLHLHHGQISGALSNLHKSGHVFMLREQRNRCHPYVHSKWRERYSNTERIDEPVRTSSNQRKDQLEELLEQLVIAIGFGRITDPDVIAQVNQLHNNT